MQSNASKLRTVRFITLTDYAIFDNVNKKIRELFKK